MSIEDITLPTLYCPFPQAVNPHVEAVEEHTLAWAGRFGLVKEEAAVARLRDSKFARLVARAYSSAPRDRLAIVSDWNTWIFLLDDQCDEAWIGKRPERLAALHAKCLEVLSGLRPKSRLSAYHRRPGRPDVPLLHALDDLRGRMEEVMPRAWMDRFAFSVSEYFDAAVWEARNRELGIWPDLETFGRLRPYTSGVYTFVDLIDLSEGETLPLVVRKHPTYQRLTLIANNVICWCNDLFSLPKERAHFDMHNLALVFQHEAGMSLQAAVDKVASLVEREVKRFVALEARLPSYDPPVDCLVERFVGVLRAWMRGNLDWSRESGRYRPAVPSAGVSESQAAGWVVNQ